MADTKRWKALENIPAHEVAKFTQLLDVVVALHNLNVLVKEGIENPIPANLPRALGSRELSYGAAKIPPFIGPQKRGATVEPQLVDAFINYLKGEVQPLASVLELRGNDSRFTPKVRTRGFSLYNSAYVLHLAVGIDGADAWTLKFTVGSSFGDSRYFGYCMMTKGNCIVAACCSCTAG